MSAWWASTATSCGACADTCPTDAITEISLQAATGMWVSDGDLVSVRSAHGRIELPARGNRAQRARPCLHGVDFPEIRTNLLVSSSADAVDVRPVAEQGSRTPAIVAKT